MSRLSLRVRLAAGAALAIVGAIALLGVAVSLLVDHGLRASLDQTLRARAVDVARLSASDPALLTASGVLEAPLGGRQVAVEVVDRQGRLLARSAALGARLLPGGPAVRAALAPQGHPAYLNARLSGVSIRLYVAPLAEATGATGGGAVLVASDTAEIDDTQRGLRLLIALSALGAALLGAAAAAVLTRRALRPLRRLADAARSIEQTGDGTQRLPTSGAAEELAELGATLNRMLAALERARQTERRFLADASHELRTPLTSLRGNAAYVARHGPDARALADIEADAARLGRLLDDLLALEREEGAQPPDGPVDLARLAGEVAEARDRVRVEIQATPTVRGDHDALERALANLVDNGLVHGPADGEVRIAVDQHGHWALVSVEDDGEGLALDEQDAAFTRFWRGAGSAGRPGSGLGLSIVAATARRHGGRVTVAGARFTLDLPAEGADGATAPEATARRTLS